MTKAELLNGLNTLLNNFLYGYVCSRLVPKETWQDVSSWTALFKGEEDDVRISLEPLSKRLTDDESRGWHIHGFENSLTRALLRESHELILLYCEQTNQFHLYKTESWFQFARVMRNIASHKQGGILTEWPKDLQKQGIMQVSWRNRELDTSMLGKAVDFAHNEVLQLLQDQIEFSQLRLR